MARRVTSGDLTLGALLVRLEEREREIAAQADETREQVTRLTAVLDELSRAAEEVRITRKTLLELPDPAPPAPSPSALELPDGAAYQEIMVVFAQADGPLRARGDGPGSGSEQHQQRPFEAQAPDRAQHPGRARTRPVRPATTVAVRQAALTSAPTRGLSSNRPMAQGPSPRTAWP